MYFEGKCQMYESKGGQGLDVFWNWYFYGNVYTQGGGMLFQHQKPEHFQCKKTIENRHVPYRSNGVWRILMAQPSHIRFNHVHPCPTMSNPFLLRPRSLIITNLSCSWLQSLQNPAGNKWKQMKSIEKKDGWWMVMMGVYSDDLWIYLNIIENHWNILKFIVSDVFYVFLHFKIAQTSSDPLPNSESFCIPMMAKKLTRSRTISRHIPHRFDLSWPIRH